MQVSNEKEQVGQKEMKNYRQFWKKRTAHQQAWCYREASTGGETDCENIVTHKQSTDLHKNRREGTLRGRSYLAELLKDSRRHFDANMIQRSLGPSQVGSWTQPFCPHGASFRVIKEKGSWDLSPWLQRAADDKTYQAVVSLCENLRARGPERPLHEAVKVKPVMPWRAVGCLLRN